MLIYDLIVIGNTLEAYFAASQAIKFKARVALVWGDRDNNHWQEIDTLILNDITDIQRRCNYLTQSTVKFDSICKLDYEQFQSWKNQVKQNIKTLYSLEKLAALGVDVIEESGEFCRLPKLAFVLKNRTIKSRRYLLAMGSVSKISEIQGLADVGYIALETLNITKLPDKLVILSKTFRGIELAQQLKRLGKQIILVIENSNLFLQEDEEILKLLQGIVEAEGIKLLINRPITQVRKIETKKWIQVGNEAIETDEIIMADQIQSTIQKLNLEGVQVRIEGDKIKTNEKLQTTNPKIYACGTAVNLYSLSNIAQYEASIAVKNAIFYPIFKLNYNYHPFRILTNPIFARVGLTEAQAKERYKNDVIIIKESYKNLVKAKRLDEYTGLCKLITRRNGVILGFHIVGCQSDEIINIVALAIKNKIKINHLSQLFTPYGTAAEMIFQISQKWENQQYQDRKIINNCLETLLFWRRKWNL
ncbi:MAG: FAD-dependent oxidoreductase [Crocosphaera sp.]